MIKEIFLWLQVSFLLAAVSPARRSSRQRYRRLAGSQPVLFRSDRGSVFLRSFVNSAMLKGKHHFEYRSADNRIDRLPALADELVRLNVDVLVAPGRAEAIAAKNATRTIPIVFIMVADPVATGLVDSLARPGGNITGLTPIAAVLAGKRLELLKETVSKLSRVAMLWNPQDKLCATMERKPTAGTRIGPSALFHGGEQRRQNRELVQRSG